MLKGLLILLFVFNISNLLAQEIDDPSVEYLWIEDSINNRKVCLNPEVKPIFYDSALTFFKFFIDNFNYPSIECFQHKVIISFIVETNGDITNKKILNDLVCDIHKEVIMVLDSLPKMKPGMIQGKSVPVRLTYPIMIAFKD